MPYTNEPWVADRWNGKKNKNEGWFEKGFEEAVRKTNQKMQARVRRTK